MAPNHRDNLAQHIHISSADDLSYSVSPSSGINDTIQTIVTGRKCWKTMKGKGEVVWPPYLEAALVEGTFVPHTNSITSLSPATRYARRGGVYARHPACSLTVCACVDQVSKSTSPSSRAHPAPSVASRCGTSSSRTISSRSRASAGHPSRSDPAFSSSATRPRASAVRFRLLFLSRFRLLAHHHCYHPACRPDSPPTIV